MNPCPRCGGSQDWRGVCVRCLAGQWICPPTSEPEATAKPHSQWGRYLLEEEIGRGGMGRVWRARQIDLERQVALKTLRPSLSSDAASRERFRREGLAVARLRHPGIVAIYEVGEHDGELFLAMELVQGETLAHRLKAGPLPAREAALRVREIAAAVQHAHEQNVIHRDLKPSNILLDLEQGGVARLTDFGLALLGTNEEAALTHTLEGIGTLSYLAPEQASGNRGAMGAPTDVYGLGAVLYHCLTGRAPFIGESPAAVLRNVVTEDAPPAGVINPGLPRDLATICHRCLEKNPARRYPTAAAVGDELDRWLRGEPIQAQPLSAVARGVRWACRRPALAGLLTTIALSLGLGLIGLTLANRKINSALKDTQSAELATRRIADQNRRQLYAADINLAQQAITAGQLGSARILLDAHRPDNAQTNDHRGFEWYHLRALTDGNPAQIIQHPTNVTAVALSKNGRWWASGDANGETRIGAVGATNYIVHRRLGYLVLQLAFSPDDTELAIATRTGRRGDGRITRLAADSWKVLGILTNESNWLAWLPGGRSFAITTANPIYAEENSPLEQIDRDTGRTQRILDPSVVSH